MSVYYNEWDKYAAQWLRNLIAAGHLPDGDVDERSITDVEPEEIKGYTQHHFFAGIGGWPLAARLAGLADSERVVTGSPPCQPFSTAGRGGGYSDERHLAPHWLRLVAAIRPTWVFGEQVAAAIRKDDWLDDLLDALEGEGYATGASVLPACSVGAPHIRQRLWVVARLADTDGKQCKQGLQPVSREQLKRTRSDSKFVRWMGDSNDARSQEHGRLGDIHLRVSDWSDQGRLNIDSSIPFRMADTECGAAERHGHEMGEAKGRMQSEARQQRLRNDAGDGFHFGGMANTALSTVSRWGIQRPGKSDRQVYEPGQEQRSERSGTSFRMADTTNGNRRAGLKQDETERSQGYDESARLISDGWMAEPNSPRPQPRRSATEATRYGRSPDSESGADRHELSSTTESEWSDSDWLWCRDGKWRPVESGTFPLANGIPGRVGRLRAYGNAIVPQVAAEIIREATKGENQC